MSDAYVANPWDSLKPFLELFKVGKCLGEYVCHLFPAYLKHNLGFGEYNYTICFIQPWAQTKYIKVLQSAWSPFFNSSFHFKTRRCKLGVSRPGKLGTSYSYHQNEGAFRGGKKET